MRIVKIERESVLDLQNGKLKEGDFQHSFQNVDCESDIYREYHKIQKRARANFLRDALRVLHEQKIEVSSISSNCPYLHSSRKRESLALLKNPKLYSQSVIEQIICLNNKYETFILLLDEAFRDAVLKEIEESEYPKIEYVKQFKDNLREIANREVHYGVLSERFHICKNLTVGFYVEGFGWIAIKL